MSTRTLFLTAWASARHAAKRFGGRAIQYLPTCLREAWATRRRFSMTGAATALASSIRANSWSPRPMPRSAAFLVAAAAHQARLGTYHLHCR